MENYQLYIDGNWTDAEGGGTFETINPFSGKAWAKLARARSADAGRAVDAAHRAFKSDTWRGMSATRRGALLRKLGDLILENADHLARTEVLDNGKLLSEMRIQMDTVAEFFHYYGGLADKIEGAVIPVDKVDTFNFTRREPLGVCVAITPWNSPLLLTAKKLAPGLAAGNTFVVKPSEFTSASVLELVRLVSAAGFPPGVVNVVTGFGPEVGSALVAHPDVAKVAFTGSEATGTAICQTAGVDFKRVSMELGGKSANIVFADANLDHAVKGAIGAVFAACGQSCVAGSRLLIHSSIYDRFVDKLVEAVRGIKLGDPMKSDTQMGPVANRPQYEKVLNYFDIAKADGARCVIGGRAATQGGQFVEPTIYTGVNNNMRIAREEVFGPVTACIPFETDDEAVEIANDSPYGLAAGIWTSSMSRALDLPTRLEAGIVWVNMYRAISVLSPFGGVKRSGLGREHGLEGINAYLETKSVWVNTGSDISDPFVIQ